MLKERFDCHACMYPVLASSARIFLLSAAFYFPEEVYAQATTGPMPSMRVLDSVYSVHGIQLGTPSHTVTWLRLEANLGKRWKHTDTFRLWEDTATIMHCPAVASFWFRGDQFIGVTYTLRKEEKTRAVFQELTRCYGPPRAGNVEGAFYWLGKRTYILYEDALPSTIVHVASLGMLNEQVIETAVRQDARKSLGWQPDSLGLPRQFPLSTEKKKK